VTDGGVGWRFLHSKRWIGYFALLLIFSVACVWLGNWQFDRRAQARAEIERIDNNYDAEPRPLSELLPDPASFDEDSLKWHPVELRGTYGDETFLARNRPGAAGVGSDLIHAFHTTDGAVFFIDRGWVPVAGADPVPNNLPQPPSGEVTVIARLRAGEPQLDGRTTAGNSVASIDLPELAQLSASSGVVYTGAYGQLVSEQPPGETGVLPPRPERDEGPHLSYALQWYVFILIAAIGVAYAARQEYRNLNAGNDSVLREDERRARRKRRRGPTDAEEEDALLDG